MGVEGRRGATAQDAPPPPPPPTLSRMTSSITLPNLPAVANRLLGLKGHFVGVNWHRPMKTRKGVAASVTKSVRTTVQVGVNYENRAVVQEARASGDAPETNAGLPWGTWELFPYVISHKDKRYVRLYPVRDAQGKPRACKVVYRVNGRSATRAEVETLCLASEFSSGAPTECYTLAVENLRAVRLARRADAKATVATVSPAARAE